MASIFNSLYTGVSGLNAAQVAIDTTSHNITNAETEGYTRQRVVTSATSMSTSVGQIGTGTKVTEIESVFDSYVFDRYVTASTNKSYSDTMMNNLEELSSYFSEIDDVGIKNDLQNYFDAWQSFSADTSNASLKVNLAQTATTLAQHINELRTQVSDLQSSLDDQISADIDEVNSIAEQIASLNESIYSIEADGVSNANDLRDQRRSLELQMSELIGADVTIGQIDSDTTSEGSYTIQVGGFNLVDGTSYHPIGVDETNNQYGYSDLYYERQDGVKIPIASSITEGSVGALIELHGFLQEVIDSLDAFAQGVIEGTNSVYAQSATTSMTSNKLSFDSTVPLTSSDSNIEEGSFDVVIYDIDGNEVARRSITIDSSTVMSGSSNGIVEQLAASVDDNNDNNALNDVNSYLTATYSSTNQLSINLNGDYESEGYTFAIVDNGTNFAGATGLNRFFDGDDAKSISLNDDLSEDTSLIRGYGSPLDGDSTVALAMVDLQNTNLTFNNGLNSNSETIYDYFDSIVTNVGTETNAASTYNDTVTAQYSAIELEYMSISSVSTDEELANLIRYQTSYSAAAKIITTLEEMLTTLLSIKS